MAKRKAWRRYYGYKRPSLSYPAQTLSVDFRRAVGADRYGSYDVYVTPADMAYVAWLSKARGISLCDAYDYAVSQPRGRIIAQSVDFLDVRQADPQGGKRWKANYTWYRPPVFRAVPLTAKGLARQAVAYRRWLAARDATVAAD